ncbi:hypothetical protein N9L02_03315, partial [Gammaproteobacteria bacterium]|nr:hypothetical protein [Gammaproteobacteria bacterium]
MPEKAKNNQANKKYATTRDKYLPALLGGVLFLGGGLAIGLTGGFGLIPIIAANFGAIAATISVIATPIIGFMWGFATNYYAQSKNKLTKGLSTLLGGFVGLGLSSAFSYLRNKLSKKPVVTQAFSHEAVKPLSPIKGEYKEENGSTTEITSRNKVMVENFHPAEREPKETACSKLITALQVKDTKTSIAYFLTDEDIINSSKACRDSKSLFKEPLASLKTRKLLQAVVYGEYDKVNKILTSNPELLLENGTVTDYSYRTHKNRTALQL